MDAMDKSSRPPGGRGQKLNLGCGGDYRPGYVNVDNNGRYRLDVRHDLDVYPYPFEDGRFREIVASHVIEHLDSPLAFLAELYRIAANGALVRISCPHFSCNWIHPGHRSAVSSKIFDFLDQNNSECYSRVDFRVEKIELKWLRSTGLGLRSRTIMKILNYLINHLANINIAVTERIWCYWVGGFEEISFRARVKK